MLKCSAYLTLTLVPSLWSGTERQMADGDFADCYDWLVTRDVSFYYDSKSRLWLLLAG